MMPIGQLSFADQSGIPDYSVLDVASSTLRSCLDAAPGKTTIRAAVISLNWNEVARTDLQDRHIAALAATRLNEVALNSFSDAEVWQDSWEKVFQDAAKAIRLPTVRNAPRQTFWFDRQGSNALLQVKTDGGAAFPSTECDIFVTADIGENSMAPQFEEFAGSWDASTTPPPVFSGPIQWSENADAIKALYTTFFDNDALAQILGDDFAFIGHLRTNHFLNTEVPS